MKKLKSYLESYYICILYIAVTSYFLVQKEQNQLTAGDLDLFLISSIMCFGLGFFSFFHWERFVRIAGMITMLSTLIGAAFMLFL